VEQMRDIFFVSLVFVLFMATIGLQLFQVRVWQRWPFGTPRIVRVNSDNVS
jgi:hypothetical protein